MTPSKKQFDVSLIDGLAMQNLYDQTKPEGQEAIPEDQWHDLLVGPCNGDEELIEAVCAYERAVRDPENDKPIKVVVDLSAISLSSMFKQAPAPVPLLW